MEIKTKRLTLTPLGMKYLQSTYAYSSDREATKYMLFLPDETMEETADFLKEVDKQWSKEEPEYYEFAILLGDRHIGAVGIYPDEKRVTGEFGWIIHKDYWGQGFASEAAAAILEYSVNALGIHHFIAHCDSENTASARVMEKLGMQRKDCYGGRKNKASDEERMECLYECKVK